MTKIYRMQLHGWHGRKLYAETCGHPILFCVFHCQNNTVLRHHFSYCSASIKMLILFVWILSLTNTTSFQSLRRFYEPPGIVVHISDIISKILFINYFLFRPPFHKICAFDKSMSVARCLHSFEHESVQLGPGFMIRFDNLIWSMWSGCSS